MSLNNFEGWKGGISVQCTQETNWRVSNDVVDRTIE